MTDGYLDYHLAETVISVVGSVTVTADTYASPNTPPLIEGEATIAVGTGPDLDDQGGFPLDLSGTRDFTVTLTTDGRLASVAHKSTGSGPKVVSGAAAIVGFVGGLVISGGNPMAAIVGAGLGATIGARTLADGVVAEGEADDEPEGDGTRPMTPDEVEAAAREAWETNHSAEAVLARRYRKMVPGLAAKLADLREEAARARRRKDRMGALSEAAAVELLLQDVRRAIAEIDGLYRAWRSGTRAATSVDLRLEVRSLDLTLIGPETIDLDGRGMAPPLPTSDAPSALEVWNAFGLVFQLQSVLPLPPPGAPQDGWRERGTGPRPAILWRQARPARLQVWKRTSSTDETLELHSVTPIDLFHGNWGVETVELSRRVFGDDACELHFDASSRPSKLVRTTTSAVASVFDALGAVPGTVTGGLENAFKARTAVADLEDFDASRAHEALKRQAESKAKELELAGLEATSDRHAELALLEQSVKIQEATGKLTGPTETARLTGELELLRARHLVDLARQGILPDEK